MRVHFVVHEVFEGPGAYGTWARDRGHVVTFSRVFAGEVLPDPTGIDLLVVMGGPQSPATTVQECPHFDAAAERRLIAGCVARGKAVVGVCLGAQLVGEALGAAHARSPEPEIGRFPLRMTGAGLADPKFAHFGPRPQVGHWHNDMPGLTDGATVLATSDGCPRQIVGYGDLVYGFQCHLEFTAETVELLIAASADDLRALDGRRFVQRPDTLRAQDWDDMNTMLYGFLDRLATAYESTAAAPGPSVPVAGP